MRSILFDPQRRVFQEGEPGAGGGGNELKLEDILARDDVKAAIGQLVTTETTGLKTKVEELLGEKKTAVDALRDFQKSWEGFDPEVVRPLLDRFANDEELKLIADGKHDEVIERRTAAMRKDFDGQLEQAQTALAAITAERDAHLGKISELIIDGTVREVALKAEVLTPALPDVVSRARSVFTLNDEHKPEARDGEGVLLKGTDGVSPLTLAEWLEGQKTDAPHWWGESAGGGSAGNRGKGGDNKPDLSNMTSRDKLRTGIEAQT